MTVIDRILFRFGMTDEQFARELYADWDGFCRRCVTEVFDEYFSRYDNKETYIEIDRLDLDLGGIPQEEFYEVFPVRLREALDRSFTKKLNDALQRAELEMNAGKDAVPDKLYRYAREKRFENLLHYLEYGFCLPEWGTHGFSLYEELLHFKETEHTERLLPLLVSRPYAMKRLLLQTGTEQLAEVIPFTTWLASAALGQFEKQRYLSVVLEHSPQALIRFIHENREAGNMDNLAELFENPHVRRIMAIETEDHAEIDVPEYWYRLYNWLLEYYPFNGVPMFGDKRHFRLHLNRRLLSFIRKREQQAYLSKADLTVRFLLEVFGADYYMTVLNIIYRNQPLNEDGSPATGDGYAWELYYILLQLSLLGTGGNAAGNTEGQSAGERQDTSSSHTDVSALLTGQGSTFERWLENPEQPEQAKREWLLRLAKERPELLIRWLKTRPERKYLSLLAELVKEPTLLLLAGNVSLQLAETVSGMSDALDKSYMSVSWLRNAGKDRLPVALNTALLQGIAAGSFSASDPAMSQLLRIAGLLYQEITGLAASAAGTLYAVDGVVSTDKSGFTDNPAIPEPLRELVESIAAGFPALNASEEGTEVRYNVLRSDRHIPATERFASLKAVLLGNSMPDMAKRLLILQWFDACQGGEREFVVSLQEEKLLDTVISLLDTAVLRHIVMRLAIQGYGTGSMESGASIAFFVRLLEEHVEEIATAVSKPPKTVWRALFVSLTSWNGSITSGLGSGYMDGAIRLLSDMAGSDKVQTVIESLIGKLLHIPYTAPSESETIYRDYDAASSLPDFGNNALFSLLVRLQQYIAAQKQDSGLFVTDTGKDGRTGTEPDIHKDSADKNSDVPTGWKDLNEARTAFEHCLNDTAGIVGWLHNGSFSVAQKRAIFLRYMADSPDKAIRLIRKTITHDENAVFLWIGIIGIDDVLRLIGQTSPVQVDELAGTINSIYRPLVEAGLFSGGIEEWDIATTKALLSLIAGRTDTGGTDTKAATSLFLRHLHYVLTGNREYTDDDQGKWPAIETPPTDTHMSFEKRKPALSEARKTFERYWDDVPGLTDRLRNGKFTPMQKRAIFLSHMAGSPDKAIRLIQETIDLDESAVALWSEIIGKDDVLYFIGQTDSALSGVLAQTIGTVIDAFAGSGMFAGSSAERDMYITRAMLLLLAERPEPGNMDVEETASLFLHGFHYVLTGNKEYTDADRKRWQAIKKGAMDMLERPAIAADAASDYLKDDGMSLPLSYDWAAEQNGKVLDKWSVWLLSPSVSDTKKSQILRYHARWQPKLLWKFVRYSAVESPGKSNIPFDRWTAWLDTEAWLEMIAGVSFSLADTLRRTTETLSGKYGIAESGLAGGLVRLIAGHPTDRVRYGNASSIVSEYIETLVVSVWKGEVPDAVREQSAAIADKSQPGPEKAETTSQPEKLQPVWESIAKDVEAELHISDTEQVLEDVVQPEYIEVPNAGLCLLAIWFPRLFDMLGLLAANADGKKDFKDIETRIQAVFILQRLVTDEVREYEEHELAFNRILTGCPFHVPLPKTLELTQNEIQTLELMMVGVKTNWDKLKNTSIKGFQRSFIDRPGKLEQREDKWVLYVENRAYDILLDSLPWSYRTIRLPWLKKKINVVWRDKEKFDF